MPFIVAGLMLVGLVAALDLVLTMAVIRKLRVLSTDPDALRGPTRRVLAPGEPLPAFAALDTDGAVVSRETLAGAATTIAFFSTTCPACWEKQTEFLENARQRTAAAEHVVAVVVGDVAEVPAGIAAQIAGLRAACRVVVEPDGGAVSTAFGVGFPSYIRAGADGRVLTHVFSADQLRLPVGAR